MVNPLLQDLNIACLPPLNVNSSDGQHHALENLAANLKYIALTAIVPQSHSSPSSTKPLPHSGGSRSWRAKREIKVRVSPKGIVVIFTLYNMFFLASTPKALTQTQYLQHREKQTRNNSK